MVLRAPSVPIASPFGEREQVLTRQLEAQVQRAENIQRAFDIYKAQRKPWTPGKTLGVVLMVSWNDYAQAIRLLDWMQQLGGTGPVPFAISIPGDLPQDLVSAITERTSTGIILRRPFPLSREHWPQGPNWSFACAAEWCHQHQWDFLLLEPDCVPIRRGWLDGVLREYRGCGRAYMGHYEPAGADHQMHLAGVAVYQWETYQRLHWHEFHRAWDVTVGPTLVAEAHQSRTIQQEWGEMGKAPTFTTTADLERIRPDTQLFHRCKDGTLIARLRETLL